jgi:hypothetical protein
LELEVRKFALLVFILVLISVGTLPARAESGVQVTDLIISYSFGEEMILEASLQTEAEIESVQVFIQSQDGTMIATEQLDPGPEGGLQYILDLVAKPVRPFALLDIWFEIELASGGSFTTEHTQFRYDDNRFEWQAFQNDEFNVYWYQPDPELGLTIYNTALEGLDRIQSQVDVPNPEDISIYAYANVVDMQDTLMFSGDSTFWIAGHAASDLGVIVVSLPPGPEQTLEIKRQIPHEMVHILLYRKMVSGYTNLPRWLNEGLASTAELFPNPDYQLLLDKAYERQALIPIQDLCGSFPMDAASFQLSYAEAYAFTNYLLETYGKDKVGNLIQAYTRGLNCDQGIQEAFQAPLSLLEAEWRQAMFNENQFLNMWLDNLPLVLVFGVVFITPLGLVLVSATHRRPHKSNSR